MSSELIESMEALSLKPETAAEATTQTLHFKLSGVTTFALDVEAGTAVRDIKKAAKEACNVEPEHMRLIHKGRQLKDADLIDDLDQENDEPVQVLFTAGHEALVGGGQQKNCGSSTGQPNAVLRGHSTNQDPFNLPVRGVSGSKGERVSRMSGRRGGMGLIRKYGIMMKRQEFREKATEIGFVKYR